MSETGVQLLKANKNLKPWFGHQNSLLAITALLLRPSILSQNGVASGGCAYGSQRHVVPSATVPGSENAVQVTPPSPVHSSRAPVTVVTLQPRRQRTRGWGKANKAAKKRRKGKTHSSLKQPEQIYLLFACDVANFANMDGLNAVRCNNTRRLRIINNHHAQK